MLKRTGWIFVFLILLGLFGLAATIDVGSALPITQSDHGAALGAVPGNLVLLAKTKCPYDFCYGCEKEKVCLVWKHNDQCTDHATSDLSEEVLLQGELLSERRLHLQGGRPVQQQPGQLREV